LRRACHHSVVVNGIAFAAELQPPVIADLFGLIVQPTQDRLSRGQALLKELMVDLKIEGNRVYPTYRIPRSSVLMPKRLVDPRVSEFTT
jgi:hypothetical protein